MQEIKRIKELVSILNKASYAYYAKDNPIMSDKQYDDLLITLSKFGTDDIDNAKSYEDNVYAGQEPEVIDDLLNKKK